MARARASFAEKETKMKTQSAKREKEKDDLDAELGSLNLHRGAVGCRYGTRRNLSHRT